MIWQSEPLKTKDFNCGFTGELSVLSMEALSSSWSHKLACLWGCCTAERFYQLTPFVAIIRQGLGWGEAFCCPLHYVVCPLLSLSSLSPFPLHCSLEDGFQKPVWSCHVALPPHFPFLDYLSEGHHTEAKHSLVNNTHMHVLMVLVLFCFVHILRLCYNWKMFRSKQVSTHCSCAATIFILLLG